MGRVGGKESTENRESMDIRAPPGTMAEATEATEATKSGARIRSDRELQGSARTME
jgi:hypothetical protein